LAISKIEYEDGQQLVVGMENAFSVYTNNRAFFMQPLMGDDVIKTNNYKIIYIIYLRFLNGFML
jgi:hypothetical protein